MALFLSGVLCWLLLLGWTIFGFFTKGFRIVSVILLVVPAVSFWAINWMVPPPLAFSMGFRTYVLSRVSPLQIENIADAVRAHVPPETALPGPAKTSLWEEKRDRRLWTTLASACAIEKLGDSCVVDFSDGEVRLTWGGALAGHWGLRITKPGGGREAGDYAALSVAPDIFVFRSD